PCQLTRARGDRLGRIVLSCNENSCLRHAEGDAPIRDQMRDRFCDERRLAEQFKPVQVEALRKQRIAVTVQQRIWRSKLRVLRRHQLLGCAEIERSDVDRPSFVMSQAAYLRLIDKVAAVRKKL